MTTDDILRMAREAGAGVYLPPEAGLPGTWWGADLDMLTRFAALVAAAEREECAKVCEIDHPHTFARHVAKQIRAKGKT